MRHRMGAAAATGLGNPAEHLMDGRSTGDKKFDALVNKAAKACHDLFLTKFGYCDAQVSRDTIYLGVEPAYQYHDLKMIVLEREKHLSRFITGRAWGAWGSEIAQRERVYESYKKRSKFVRFVDEWHEKLFQEYDLAIARKKGQSALL